MKISVIIPVYNVKPYLERCVQSVVSQTYKDLEIVLVDDGSTDGSGELCDQLAATDSRIQVVHQVNKGLSEARNTGIRQATGDYVFFVDSDDGWLLDDGVEQLVNQCEATTDLLMFKAVDIYTDGRQTPMKDFDVEHINSLPDGHAVFAYLVKTQVFRAGVWLLMVRRSILTGNDIFFPSGLISEDVYWDMQLWQHIKKVKIVNLNFYGYYFREGGLSKVPSIRVYRSYDKIFTDWKEQCRQGCVNASEISLYLAEMWVSRAYAYYQLKPEDKPESLAIMERHKDLLYYADTPKSRRTAFLVKTFGVKSTTTLLGIYWRLRNYYKHVV